MFTLPNQQTKKWNQPNNSDRFGTLFVTKNMDFDQEGYARLSKRSRSLMDSTVDSDLGEIVAFGYDVSTSRYYCLSEGHIFYSSTLTSWTDDASSNVPTTIDSNSDMVSFNGYLYVSAGITDGLRRMSAGTWSTSQYALTSDTAPMAVFINQNALCIGQDNTVLMLDTTHALLFTLMLGADFKVTSLDYANNRMYVGTRHQKDGEAYLFEWDGKTNAANNSYPCGSVRIDCVKAYKGTVVIMTGEGQLLGFSGGGLKELANLPVYYTNYLYSRQGNSSSGNISHRGMIVTGDVILLNIENFLQTSNADTTLPASINTFPGGIWCYDPNVGLYHKHTISGDILLKSNAVTTANVNTTTDVITIAGVTVPETGTRVLYDDGANGVGTQIATIKHRTTVYYVINVSSSTMKLATTRANALAGTAIDLTGTGNNSQYFVFYGNRDFGSDRPTTRGALFAMNSKAPARSDGMSLLFGSGVAKTSASTTVYSINALGEKQENRGFLIAPRLDATKITDDFVNVTVKFKGIKTADDTILFKYRNTEREDLMKFNDIARTQTATFTSTTTFTTTADLALAKVGDEVEFHFGTQQGYTAHITVISLNAGTYTITIDETMRNLTTNDTCLFTIDNWEKHPSTITTSDVSNFTTNNGDTITGIGGAKTFQIGKQSTWFQPKFELRGEDLMIEDILINNRPMKEFIA